MPFGDFTSIPKVSLALLLGIAIIGGASAGRAQERDDRSPAGLGRAVALNVCTPCHIVMPDQEFPPIFEGPPKPPELKVLQKFVGTWDCEVVMKPAVWTQL